MFIYRSIFETFCSSIPLDKTWIPKELPHPDPEGESIAFPIRLLVATPAEILAFLEFRGASSPEIERKLREAKGLAELESQILLQTREAAVVYKGELIDTKSVNWEYAHFELRKKGLKFPVASPHWNGWAGWWLGLGPGRKR